MRTAVLLLLTLLTGVAWAAERRLVTLSDPQGDDVGNGALLYPAGTEFRRGDLDLRRLEVSRDDTGFWFVATFTNPIREKWWAPPDIGDLSPSREKRVLPFNFNLDIYVDTDHVPGSGQMFTLPGRKVRIDPRFAWERAVILTPQPRTARAQLLATLKKNLPGRPKGEAEANIDGTMFFATRIHIRENAISFFVPAEFFSPSDGSDWAITAFVTAASLTMGDDNLGVMQVEKEPSTSALGFSSQNPPPPIIDVLLPSPDLQFRLLASTEPLTGVFWGPTRSNQADVEAYLRSFKERLNVLQRLLDQGLIDAVDFKAQRMKILDEL